MNHIPMQIRAYLQTPIICDQYLPIDAVLYHHFIRSIYGPKKVSKIKESTVRQYSGKDLPLAKVNTGSHQWFYAASFAQWPQETLRDVHEYARRFDTMAAIDRVDFKGRRGRINLAGGTYKNYWVREYTFNTPYVDWYLRGDFEAVQNLLAFCTHLGKKTAQGCGSVLRWELSPVDRDWSVYNDQGQLMRAIPDLTSNFTYGIRPSYWNARHIFPAKLPADGSN